MAKYSGNTTKATTDTAIGMASIEAPGASPRRVRLTELILGSGASAADNTFLFRLIRTTAASTGSAVTPNPLDEADAAAITLVKEAITVEGALGVELIEIPLNQRATFHWRAAPGSELVIPATALAGILLQTPVAQSTPRADASWVFDE